MNITHMLNEGTVSQAVTCIAYSHSAGIIPAAHLAVEYINNDSSILPGYFLNIALIDDKVY